MALCVRSFARSTWSTTSATGTPTTAGRSGSSATSSSTRSRAATWPATPPSWPQRGLRVAGVAGAGQPPRGRARVGRGRARAAPLELRRDPEQPARRQRDPGPPGAAATRSAGCRASWPRSSRPSSTAGRPWAAVVLREQRRSPRDPRHGLTMLLARGATRSSCARASAGARHVQLDRLDLPLPVRAAVDRAGGADPVAGAGQRVRAQRLLDVDHRQPRQRDRLARGEHEVGVAVAVGVHALDVDDAAAGRAAVGELGWAARRVERGGGGGALAAGGAAAVEAGGGSRRRRRRRSSRRDEQRRSAAASEPGSASLASDDQRARPHPRLVRRRPA